MSQDLYAYLRERSRLGSRGLAKGVGLSVAAHALVAGALLFSPGAAKPVEEAKITWVTLPAMGGAGAAGGQGPLEAGRENERQRRVEEVAPKLDEPATGASASPNAWGVKPTRPVQGTSRNPDSLGKAPVASKKVVKKKPVVRIVSITHKTTTPPKKKVVTKHVASSPTDFRVGVATWYDDPHPFGCATKYLPFGLTITVKDLATGKSITCLTDDREGAGGNRVVDLSETEFAELAPLSTGVVPVRVTW